MIKLGNLSYQTGPLWQSLTVGVEIVYVVPWYISGLVLKRWVQDTQGFLEQELLE
jgi:hypothetical protein